MISLRHAVSLGVALRERTKDLLLPALPVVPVEHLQVTKIELSAFHSSVPFNPELYQRWSEGREQDTLDESVSPAVLKTDFEYEGLILNNGRILSDGITHVSIFGADNRLQKDYSTHHQLKPLEVLKRAPARVIAGTTLNLCAPLSTVQGNFAHWLTDALGRWILLEDCATESVQIDQFLIPPNKSAFRESLRVLGVADDRMVELSLHEAMEFERLVCVSRPRGYSSNVVPGWLIEGYRTRLGSFMSEPAAANQRLYISRKDAGSRKFRQEDTLVAELEQRGFKSVEMSSLGLREKAELFSQATDVIGLAGAGMMSVMFSPPDTRVVELYPSNFLSYMFATISAALGHEHHTYIFKNNSKKRWLHQGSGGEFDLDLKDFLSSLDSWLEDAPQKQ
ncbi:glycosyltransferase family 61 protein [Granulosicoccus antarcticus]|uniref:Glycosyltransferase 61 catalytic domain-containing protein n=1 Tax=Granulosicoccus antarcticus IMCC3135 TaxID=1192854 RepID=A0A2Z2NT99_9GAMM|nr:glycosyltransferase family 61 protein [Granulosicoccus antarcticus]ASJ74539.1 hypothetical protein IMCC3135_22345 [Granulosicoccus antarcticus IMCC3135]